MREFALIGLKAGIALAAALLAALVPLTAFALLVDWVMR